MLALVFMQPSHQHVEYGVWIRFDPQITRMKPESCNLFCRFTVLHST